MNDCGFEKLDETMEKQEYTNMERLMALATSACGVNDTVNDELKPELECAQKILDEFGSLTMQETLTRSYFTKEVLINADTFKGSKIITDVFTKFNGIVRNFVVTSMFTHLYESFFDRLLLFEVTNEDMGLYKIKLYGCKSPFCFKGFNFKNLIFKYFENLHFNVMPLKLDDHVMNIGHMEVEQIVVYFLEIIEKLYGIKYLYNKDYQLLIPDTTRSVELFKYLNEHAVIESNLDSFLGTYPSPYSNNMKLQPKSRFTFNDAEGKIFNQFPELFIMYLFNVRLYYDYSEYLSEYERFGNCPTISAVCAQIDGDIKLHNDPNFDRSKYTGVNYVAEALEALNIDNTDDVRGIYSNIFRTWINYNIQNNASYGLTADTRIYSSIKMTKFTGNEITMNIPIHVSLIGMDLIYLDNIKRKSISELAGLEPSPANQFEYPRIGNSLSYCKTSFDSSELDNIIFKTKVDYETVVNGKQNKPLLLSLAELSISAIETHETFYGLIDRDSVLYKKIVKSIIENKEDHLYLEQLLHLYMIEYVLAPMEKLIADVMNYKFVLKDEELYISVYTNLPIQLSTGLIARNDDLVDIYSYGGYLDELGMIFSIFAKLAESHSVNNLGTQLVYHEYSYDNIDYLPRSYKLTHLLPTSFYRYKNLLEELENPSNFVMLARTLSQTGFFIDGAHLLDLSNKLLNHYNNQHSIRVMLLINNIKNGYSMKAIIV